MDNRIADSDDFIVDAYKIVESCPDLYLILNAEFKIVGVSNAYCQATLVEREKILGLSIFEVFPDNPADTSATGVRNLSYSLKQVLQKKIPNTMAVQKYDVRLPKSQGGEFVERYWSPINTPVLDSNGEVKYIIHRAEDVTEFVLLKRLENQRTLDAAALLSRAQQMEIEIYKRAQEIQDVNKKLQIVNKELENFAHITSHDLKSPLRAVETLADWIMKDPNNQLSKESMEWYSLLRKRIYRMFSTIEGILAYSKAGKLNLEISNVDLNELLHEVINDINPPKTFSVRCQENMPVFQTAKIPLGQVFFNLINNAIKHHHQAKGYIEVGYRDVGDFYEFFVKDDGPGIDRKNHEKIFVLFETLQTEKSETSTGIGLSIVKKIVTSQNGKVRLESEPGKGTTFYFTWPKKV